jgi:predicted transcriptional regulator YheO
LTERDSTTAVRSRELERLAPLVGAIAGTFGPYCEVMLHDLSRPDHSIVAIANGHVTGRRVGDALDPDLYRLSQREGRSDAFVGWRAHTADGRPLRCTTVLFRDQRGRPVAALGINVDLSLTQAFSTQLGYLLQEGTYEKRSPIAARSVNHLIGELVEEAVRRTGKAIDQLDREDRVLIARHLQERGAFAIRRSVSTVARTLGVSRVAMYTYIEEAKRLIESTQEAEAR